MSDVMLTVISVLKAHLFNWGCRMQWLS